MTDQADNYERRKRHDLVNGLISLRLAAMLAHQAVTQSGKKATEEQCDIMADTLSHLATLYSLSRDREQIRTLSASDLRGGVFVDGGESITFSDGREPITGLAMTRRAYDVAVMTMRHGAGA